jgi:hypothetical protein
VEEINTERKREIIVNTPKSSRDMDLLRREII